jgi:hypothetical protein
MAEIIADESGEEITSDLLDQCMSLVVNDHDDPFTLIREHGSIAQQFLIEDLIRESGSSRPLSREGKLRATRQAGSRTETTATTRGDASSR